MKTFTSFAILSIILAADAGCSAPLSASKEELPKTVIAAGTVLKVVLIDSISTDRSTPGDYFSAALAEAVVLNGKTLLETGTAVRGQIFDLREPRHLNGGAALHLVLTGILCQNKMVAITTRHFSAVADNGAITGKDIHLAANTRLDFILETSLEIGS